MNRKWLFGITASLALTAITPLVAQAATQTSPNLQFQGITSYLNNMYIFYNGTYDSHIHINTYQIADNGTTADMWYGLGGTVPNQEVIGNGTYGLDWYSDSVGRYDVEVFNNHFYTTSNPAPSGYGDTGNMYVSW